LLLATVPDGCVLGVIHTAVDRARTFATPFVAALARSLDLRDRYLCFGTRATPCVRVWGGDLTGIVHDEFVLLAAH